MSKIGVFADMEIGWKGTSYLKPDFRTHWLVLHERMALKAPKNFSRKQ